MTSDRLIQVARAWFDDDIVTRVFEPLVADWQREHESLHGPARRRSTLRIHLAFITTASLLLPWQLKRKLPESVVLSGWIAMEAFIVLGIFVQWYFYFDANPRGVHHLLPAALGIALPLSLLPAAIIVSRFGTVVEARTMMLRLTLLGTFALAPVLAWWMPHSNQAWRVAQHASDRPPLRGHRELTVNELFRSRPPIDLALGKQVTWPALRRDAAFERLSVLFMPLTMMAAGLAVANRARRRRSLVALASWTVAGLMWLTLLDFSPWMAHVLLLSGVLASHAVAHPTVPPKSA